jgi:hypothetical protein
MTALHKTAAIRAAALAVALLCAGACARLAAELEPPAVTTVLEPYPRFGDKDAVVFNDLPVRLFFFSQAPPAGTIIAKPVRVIFKTAVEGATCREAGIGGLLKLQRVAVRQRFNAIVNLRATWEGEQLGDALRFGCRRIGRELQLIWEGALANVPPEPATQIQAADETPPAADADDASGRIKELQRLYYEGLITREEFLERRQKILDGL